VIRAVVETSLDANHGIACYETACDTFAKTLFNCGEEVLGNCAANNLVGWEYELFFAHVRLETDPNVTKLTVTAGLLLMTSLLVNNLADRFSVSNAGSGKLNLNAKLILKLGND
jgi:hypothetical protein